MAAVPADSSSAEADLIARARSGHDQALDELFGRHGERLRKTIRLRLDRRLRDRFSSSAVLRQVQQEAHRRLHEYPSGTSLFLWLRGVAGQVIQSLHRQHLGSLGWEESQEVSFYHGALPGANSVSLAAQMLGQVNSATQAAQRAEMQLRLQNALNTMDPLDREVLTLCHFEELTAQEAASVLGIDKATAYLRHLKAVKRLKEILNSIPGFFPGQ
jgi:RNA polymerase sigma-70 factor (ECF subfamily)